MTHLHFFDERTEDTLWETEGEGIPRKGDTICFTYNDAFDAGMWVATDVTWQYDRLSGLCYVEIQCAPYDQGDWMGSADAQVGQSPQALVDKAALEEWQTEERIADL